MAAVNPITYAGVGTGVELLALPLIALKDWHVINWSWWWVMAPVWGPSALAVLILIGAGIGFGAGAIWKALRRRGAGA